MKNIYSDNVDEINKQLDVVQHNCKERLLSAEKCIGVIDLITTGYSAFTNSIYKVGLRNVPKCKLKGTRIIIHASMERLPRSYKYPAQETSCEFEYDGKGWKFIKCSRDRIKPSAKAILDVELFLSDTAKQAILDDLLIL